MSISSPVDDIKQHLDNLRRKDSLRGAETTEICVRLGNYSASHFEGSAHYLMRHCPRGFLAPQACLQPAKRPSQKCRGLACCPRTLHQHPTQIPLALACA